MLCCLGHAVTWFHWYSMLADVLVMCQLCIYTTFQMEVPQVQFPNQVRTLPVGLLCAASQVNSLTDPEDSSSQHLSVACLRARRSATSSSCTRLRFHHGCLCRALSGVTSVLHFNTKASLCCCVTSSCTSLVFIMNDCDELSVVVFLVRRRFGGLFL